MLGNSARLISTGFHGKHTIFNTPFCHSVCNAQRNHKWSGFNAQRTCRFTSAVKHRVKTYRFRRDADGGGLPHILLGQYSFCSGPGRFYRMPLHCHYAPQRNGTQKRE
jgi:hypothetical protein